MGGPNKKKVTPLFLAIILKIGNVKGFEIKQFAFRYMLAFLDKFIIVWIALLRNIMTYSSSSALEEYVIMSGIV